MIRLTKSNKAHDRLLIAVDAICAVEECVEQHNTRVMTMDGFWYEVVDSIEKIEKMISGKVNRPKHNDLNENVNQRLSSKKDFVKKHRVLSPAVEKPQERPNTVVFEER